MGYQNFTQKTAPLFSQRFVGFDKLFDDLESTLNNSLTKYPPYNIVTDMDETFFRIELAVAGFSKEDIKVSLTKNELTVAGEIADAKSETDLREVHRGISRKNFSRSFTLAEHLEVDKLSLDNGILTIEMIQKLPIEKATKHFDIT